MTSQYVYILDTGVINVDTADMLSDVQGEWKDALSQQLNLAASTPQGTMIGAETTARVGVMKNNAEMANTLNPNYTYGSFLDGVCSFLGVERGANRNTIATNIPVLGTPQTNVQAGSRVQTVNGDVFQTLDSFTIPASGTINIRIGAQKPGPVNLPIGPLTIIDGTIGWGSLSVTAAAVITLGVSSLTDPQLKNARNKKLATLGKASSAAIQAAVLNVANVTSVNVVENNTGAVGLVNGVTFTKPNAMWVCVAGNPNPQDVADALYAAHNGGCPWDYGASNGVPVSAPNGVRSVDPVTGVGYFSLWTTPVLYDTYVIATVGTGTSATSPVEGIQNAIIAYSSGNIAGEQGFTVGANVSGFELAGAISLTMPGLYIKSVQVACVPAGSAPPAPAAYGPEFVMNPFWQAQIAIGNIKVNIV